MKWEYIGLFVLLFSISVAAQPPLPHSFYGKVFYNNTAATTVMLIEALDLQNSSLGTYQVQTLGQYGFLHARGDDPGTTTDEGAVANDTVVFRINGKFAQESALWTSGRQQNLTLHVFFQLNDDNETINESESNSTSDNNETQENQSENQTAEINGSVCDLNNTFSFNVPSVVNVNASFSVSGTLNQVNLSNCSLIPSMNSSISLIFQSNSSNLSESV